MTQAHKDAGESLHPNLERIIREHVRTGGPFQTVHGPPGLHSEVQAAGELLKANEGLKLSDINVATLKLFTEGPEHVPACTNCSPILRDVDVAAGRVDE